MKRDYLAWAALAAALVVTASAEYALARAAGFGQWTAAGVPAALDIYAVRAMRAHRDVPAVVGAMILVNAAAHMVEAELLTVSWYLVVGVSAIAPLVLWRVHRLAEVVTPDEVTETLVHRVEVPIVTPDEVTVTPAAAIEQAPTIPAVKPLVICGDRRVFVLLVTPPDPDDEVTDEPDDRLLAEAAANVIRACWVLGIPVTETARQATRSTSYVKKVFARLDEGRDRLAAEQAAPRIALVKEQGA